MLELLNVLKEQTKDMEQQEAISFVESFGDSEIFESFVIESYGQEVLDEFIVKTVNAKGTIVRKKDRKTRERRALQTTGLSKAKRRQIARKATKTKRADPSIKRRANRKRKRAMAKRKAFGL